MRKRIAIVAGLCVSLGASSASADSVAACRQGRSADFRLRACSEVIANPAYGADEKALAYRNRGNAHADAGANAQPIRASGHECDGGRQRKTP
jgi:hypothetical protein